MSYSTTVSTFTTQVTRQLDLCEEQQWNDLCQFHDYFSYNYLRGLARSELDCSPRYFLVREKERVVGIGSGYFARFPLWGPLQPSVFVSGSPLNLGFPFACAPDASKEAVFSHLIQAMLHEARQEGAASLVLRDVQTSEEISLCDTILGGQGFRRKPLFQRAVLTVQWATFADYLAALRSRYREQVRREQRKIKALGYQFTVLRGACAESSIADMVCLWQQVYRKHADKDQLSLSASYFREMIALPECLVLCLHFQGQLAAFGLAFERGSVLETTYCGVDYALAKGLPVHRYLEYEAVRYAIERDLEMVDFGISHEIDKLRLGCTLYGLYAYIRPLSKTAALLARLQLDRPFWRPYGFAVQPPAGGESQSGVVHSSVFRSMSDPGGQS